MCFTDFSPNFLPDAYESITESVQLCLILTLSWL